MTALDTFEPQGEKIHPFDLHEILESLPAKTLWFIKEGDKSPSPEDEADYHRNVNKTGTVIEIAGKKYFQTCTVPPKTTKIF